MVSSFWDKQPVGNSDNTGPVEKEHKKINEPTKLPDGLHWGTVQDPAVVTQFLNTNYIEDNTMRYRLTYSEEFLGTLFSIPSHLVQFSLGLFSGDQLVGYVLAKKHSLSVCGSQFDAVSINFLCLAKEYRNLNLAPRLILEIKRIANNSGIFQAIFTGQHNFGFSISSIRYYHLALNSNRLVEVGFINRELVFTGPSMRNSTRKAVKTDFTNIHKAYSEKYKIFNLHESFNESELESILQYREGVIHTIYNDDADEFASYFSIDTNSIDKSIKIKVAYLYYWAGSSEIIGDAIAHAKETGFDMFNVLCCGENDEIIKEYNFMEGTGQLKYYLYNWNSRPMNKNEVNFILF